MTSSLLNSLKITKPLILAPMGAGPSTPQLAAAVSNQGALGALACAYESPEVMAQQIATYKTLSTKPLNINLFVPHKNPEVTSERIEKALVKTRLYREELNLTGSPNLKPPYFPDFDQQFAEVLKAQPTVFSFIFGIPGRDYLNEAKKRNIVVMGTATSVEEAQALEEAGVDVIIAQGIEAGGHRGLFDPEAQDSEVSLNDLVKDVKAKLKKPVVAAGGIMSAQDVKAVLKLGADAVQMGTAFLATKEAGTGTAYRNKLLESSQRKTKTTRAFSGRLARGIENRLMCDLDAVPEAILPFPVQNSFTRDIRNAAAKINNPDYLSLWSGTGSGTLWQGSAADLVDHLFDSSVLEK